MLKALLFHLVILAYVNRFVIEGTKSDNEVGHHDRILSRKRRYLVFPEGSSIQLVYCFTIPIQANFVFATTAALAWGLPADADDILLRRRLNITERMDKVKTTPIKTGTAFKRPQNSIYYKPVAYRPQYVQFPQPVRYKTITLSPSYRKSYNRRQYNRRRPSRPDSYHYYANRQRPVTTYVDPVHNELHRRSRRDLFGKIEKFFKAQRKDGRSCLLKAVCEVNQVGDGGKGTFVQEMIKAIFRIPSSHKGEEDIYDTAAKTRENCTELYPSCDFSLWNIF